MRPVTTGFIAAAITWVAAVSGQAQQSTDSVAAFARLYGVVRYFYPSVRVPWREARSVAVARDVRVLTRVFERPLTVNGRVWRDRRVAG
jgi:hypothetical protein